MDRVIKILMRRDSLTEDEAIALVLKTRQMMADCNYEIMECEEILMNNLGFSLDRIMDIL